MLVVIGHPVLLWIALAHINVLGNLMCNYACFAVFMADLGLAVTGGVYIEAKRQGII